MIGDLARTRAFSYLSREKLEIVVTLAQRRNFAKGSVLIEEGAENRDLFFLLSGTVSVYSGGKLIARYGRAGDVFGEMSVVSGARTSATVIANEAVETIVIDADKVGSFASVEDAQLVSVFYKLFSFALLEKLKLATIKARLFEDATRHLLCTIWSPPGIKTIARWKKSSTKPCSLLSPSIPRTRPSSSPMPMAKSPGLTLRPRACFPASKFRY